MPVWEVIAPMMMLIVLILTTGGVILLRPLTKQLGNLLEAMAAERRDPAGIKEELARLRELNELMSERLTLLEEKQEFTEALLKNPERQRLRSGDNK
jgi:hypothetical protein